MRFHRSDDYGDNPYEEYADFAMDGYQEIPVHKGIFDNSGLEQLVAAVSVNIKQLIFYKKTNVKHLQVNQVRPTVKMITEKTIPN